MLKLYSCNSEIELFLKEEYPNLKSVVCAAFGISHGFFEDDTYTNEVAQSLYSDLPNPGSFLPMLIFKRLKPISKLTDNSLMPYGIHKGKAMVNLPDDYLKWLYSNDKCSPDVLAYIENNADTLKIKLNGKK